MKTKTILSLFIAALTLPTPISTAIAEEKKSVHEFSVKDINGKDVDLSKYKGKTLLIVNVASKCGATPQYENLVALQKTFKKKGLLVLGFPANNYGKQEPGTNDQIKEFCSSTYQVDFPMFAKVSVKGGDQAPLFKFLTTADNPDRKGDIGWNFEKFLISKDGKLLRRFKTGVKPDSPEVIAAVEEAVK
ncbi:MAG: glutathione peroxidase [Verrucomicrobia bacterium]|nr:glutathione peroxidase [Verrucomicrobiota bacterium]